MLTICQSKVVQLTQEITMGWMTEHVAVALPRARDDHSLVDSMCDVFADWPFLGTTNLVKVPETKRLLLYCSLFVPLRAKLPT